MSRKDRARPSPAPEGEGAPVIRPGGKLDPDALRRAIERAETAPEDAEEAVLADPSDDDAPNRVVFALQRDLNKRLDRYLTDRIPFMSRTQLQRLIGETDVGTLADRASPARSGVMVNGRKPKASTRLRRGDVVEVFVPPPPPTEIQPEDIPIEVMYEDASILVLNKAPDIIVHPARSHLSGTLINALAHHFRSRSAHGGALSTVGEEFARPGVVHRLDRHTSGCIVFAKDDEAHWKMGRQFENRTVDKRYLAIVHGRMEPEADVIDLPIGPHPSKAKGYREKYVVRHDELGKPSVTIYRVRALFPEISPGSGPFSLVELELKTGRTHQIRVHLSHLGYPIVGDDMYGGRNVAEPGDPETPIITRQALHAAMLGFRHPISGEPMTFTAPLRGDMARMLEVLTAAATDAGDPDPFRTPPGATLEIATLWTRRPEDPD